MSGKGEKAEKASGSKMLKKARSFREDFKGLIKRRPSNSSTHGLPPGAGGKPKVIVNGSGDRDPDLEKLQTEVNNVYRSLRYIKAVVDGDKLQIVPSTATVILDTVNDVFTILNNFFMNQDSSTIISHHNKVCQSLAHFIKWADDLLIQGPQILNKDNAHQLIAALSDGMEELTQICIDRWEERHRKTSSQQSPKAPSSPAYDSSKRNSLPDIPLTPREREILDKTSNLGGCCYDNGGSPGMPVSRSSDSVTMNNGGTVFDFSAHKEPSPPPKPPLPQNADVIVPQIIQRSLSQEVPDGDDAPPPLPDKSSKRRSQVHNMLEMVTSASQTHAGTGGHTSPATQSPYSSMVLTGSSTSGTLDYSLTSSNGSLASQSSSLSAPGGGGGGGGGPSPSSSEGSGLNHSAEDLITSQRRTQRVTTFSKAVSDSKLLKTSSTMSGSHSACTVNQINQLTQEIDKLTQLTAEMEAMTRQNGGQTPGGGGGGGGSGGNLSQPPPLPTKANKSSFRLVSQYDNFPEGVLEQSFSSTGNSSCTRTVISRTVTSRVSQSSQSSEARLSTSSTGSSQSFSGVQMAKSNTIAFSQHAASGSQEDHYSSSGSFSSASLSSMENLHKQPPPLPPKLRHIQAYMQTFGAYTQPQGLEYISRHSMNFYEAQWQRHQAELSHSLYPRSNTISVISDFSSDSSFGGSAPGSPLIPALPAKRRFGGQRDSQVSSTSSQSDALIEVVARDREKTISLIDPPLTPPTNMEQKRASAPAGQLVEPPTSAPLPTTAPVLPTTTPVPAPAPSPPAESPSKPDIPKDADSDFAELNPLDDIDVSDQLIYKQPREDGPDIRGGSVDALIVHAAAAAKSEFMYQEAFLTTYRTFISAKELIEKLLYRFNKFQFSPELSKKKSARNSFSLLIRVIDLMSLQELDTKVIEVQMELVFELLCRGDLTLARVLRRKLMEKCEARKAQREAASQVQLLSSMSVTANPPELLQFKSHEIAEQMTLIDADLFQLIEIPEVLLWAKEMSEELSPNLTMFTEHFNKMSYWCRTRILLQTEAKEREKYLVKFIKIMRHLRKMSNFNSYLAILSALDSAPIRRLEWQRQNLDTLKELSQLIDSSASFKAYRLALADTEPPCIPYIGLILQDLTFINIGNQDNLPDGSVNFAKRWQQFHILDSMRRFRDKKCNYEVKKNEKILTMFDDFNDYLGEEALWQISEEIRPRRTKPKPDTDL